MDAVSEVLIARSARTDGLSSMLSASAIAHIVLLGVFVFLPAAWFGAESKQPETVMTISLGGPIGEDKSGLTPITSVTGVRPRNSGTQPCQNCTVATTLTLQVLRPLLLGSPAARRGMPKTRRSTLFHGMCIVRPHGAPTTTAYRRSFTPRDPARK